MKNDNIYNVSATPTFLRNAKTLNQKYQSFEEDLSDLSESLKINPFQGDTLGINYFKIKLSIKSKNIGKRVSSNVMIFIKIIEQNILYLIIYDKTDKDSVKENELKELINEISI